MLPQPTSPVRRRCLVACAKCPAAQTIETTTLRGSRETALTHALAFKTSALQYKTAGDAVHLPRAVNCQPAARGGRSNCSTLSLSKFRDCHPTVQGMSLRILYSEAQGSRGNCPRLHAVENTFVQREVAGTTVQSLHTLSTLKAFETA